MQKFGSGYCEEEIEYAKKLPVNQELTPYRVIFPFYTPATYQKISDLFEGYGKGALAKKWIKLSNWKGIIHLIRMQNFPKN